MTPLQIRMSEELRLRNLAEATRDAYLRAVDRFAGHFGKSPEGLGAEDVRRYLLYLLESAPSPLRRSFAYTRTVAETCCAVYFSKWPSHSALERRKCPSFNTATAAQDHAWPVLQQDS